jgi:hypothetical protein
MRTRICAAFGTEAGREGGRKPEFVKEGGSASSWEPEFVTQETDTHPLKHARPASTSAKRESARAHTHTQERARARASERESGRDDALNPKVQTRKPQDA